MTKKEYQNWQTNSNDRLKTNLNASGKHRFSISKPINKGYNCAGCHKHKIGEYKEVLVEWKEKDWVYTRGLPYPRWVTLEDGKSGRQGLIGKVCSDLCGEMVIMRLS